MKRVILSILLFVFSIPSLLAQPIDITDWWYSNASISDKRYYIVRNLVDGVIVYYRFEGMEEGSSFTSPTDLQAAFDNGTYRAVPIIDGIVPVMGGHVVHGRGAYYEIPLGGEIFRVTLEDAGNPNSSYTPFNEAVSFPGGYVIDGVGGFLANGTVMGQFRHADESTLRALAALYGLEINGPGDINSNDVTSTPLAAVAITVLVLAYGFYAFSAFGFGGGRG